MLPPDVLARVFAYRGLICGRASDEPDVFTIWVHSNAHACKSWNDLYHEAAAREWRGLPILAAIAAVVVAGAATATVAAVEAESETSTSALAMGGFQPGASGPASSQAPA